uniref:Uncharacterized protein n=1 Tax=Rhizophora mucronata TaxID=61149 RepID=A0A2P2N2U3_RHIMU
MSRWMNWNHRLESQASASTISCFFMPPQRRTTIIMMMAMKGLTMIGMMRRRNMLRKRLKFLT